MVQVVDIQGRGQEYHVACHAWLYYLHGLLDERLIRSQPRRRLDMFVKLNFVELWPGKLLLKRVVTGLSLFLW
ncbi:hypothetical protein Tco_1270139 [Tanacetum coccineum]